MASERRSSNSASNSSGPPLTREERAQAHVLHIEGCPPIDRFEQLIALAEPSVVQAAPVDADAPSVAHPDAATLLDSLLTWCSALFLTHDRAMASSALFDDIQAALNALQPNSRRRSSASANSAAAAAAATSASVPAAIDPAALQNLQRRISAYPFPYIARVRGEFGELRRACAPEKPDASWTVLDAGTEGEHIASFYRAEPAGGTHSFLVSGIVEAPLLNVVAMLKEAPLLHTWLPAVKESALLHELDASRYRMLLRVVIGAYWPMADREAMLYGYGDVVDGSVGVYFRSTEDNEVFPGAGKDSKDVTVPPVSSGAVRVHVQTGGFFFTPLNARRTRVRALFNVNPMLPILPYWFLNTMSSKFCGAIIGIMRSRAPRLFQGDSEYKRRMAEQPRVYDEIKARLAEMDQRLAEAGEQVPVQASPAVRAAFQAHAMGMLTK